MKNDINLQLKFHYDIFRYLRVLVCVHLHEHIYILNKVMKRREWRRERPTAQQRWKATRKTTESSFIHLWINLHPLAIAIIEYSNLHSLIGLLLGVTSWIVILPVANRCGQQLHQTDCITYSCSYCGRNIVYQLLITLLNALVSSAYC